MSTQIHPRNWHQNQQQNRYKNISVLGTSTPVLDQHSKPSNNREPTMPTRIAILNRTIQPNIPDRVLSPYRSWIAMIRFDECSKESINKNKTKNNISFSLTMTCHNHRNNPDKNESRINGHCDDHEKPVQVEILHFLHP
jgi:hypothetical protein